MLRRREFVGASIALTSSLVIGLPARATARPLKILILGGTNFVGPHLVHSALQAGHEVTLFNRGETNPHLFPGLEKLRGDRSAPDGLASLGRARQWDAVIDTWAKAPRAVEASAQRLQGRTGRYAYVSSIAVYGGFKKIGLTEADPILSLERRPEGDGDEVGYVWAKRLGEESVTKHFPQAHLVARGSSIFGFDSSAKPDNQSLYWPIRLRAGGRILAPGTGNDLVQYTDVGSLADFVIDNLAKRTTGAFNVANQPIRMRAYLESLTAVANPAADLVWVPQDFLIANGATPFDKVPMWIPADDAEPGFFQFDTSRALAFGMPVCALEKTLSAVLHAYSHKPAHWQPEWAKVGGMGPELERGVLEKWASAKVPA